MISQRTRTLEATRSGRIGRPVILGITGGIASGKSTVVKRLTELGACTISADAIARELLAPGTETTRAVLQRFGGVIALDLDSDRVDRKKLAALIYSDETCRRELGEIMHPEIRLRMLSQIDQAKRNPDCRLIAVEIPLLFENGLESLVDKILVASCSESAQVERLRERQPWLEEAEALRQIRSQIPIHEKVDRADYVIDTSGDIGSTCQAARSLFDRLTVRQV